MSSANPSSHESISYGSDAIGALIPELKRFHVTIEHADQGTGEAVVRKHHRGYRCLPDGQRNPKARAPGAIVKTLHHDRSVRRPPKPAARSSQIRYIDLTEVVDTKVKLDATMQDMFHHDQSVKLHSEAMKVEEARVDFVDLTEFKDGDDMKAFLDANLIRWTNRTEIIED
ncbi:hypothetical protein FPRO03_03442 [Fusarium proliferatum]|nr:hypothetical protein FPRO03_03442 [Fusarium proliferatum]